MWVIFDVVGTLFSLERTRAALRDQAVPEDVLPLWFARLLQGAMAATLAERYVPFREMAGASLRQVLALKDLPGAAPEPILRSLQELEPWEDAHACLSAIRQEGHPLVALTNSGPEAASALMRKAGFTEMFEAVLSADEAGACKPHPAPYHLALARMGAPPEEACLVAAHGWDVLGAHSVGMRTVWVSRLERRWPFPGEPPGAAVLALSEVPGTLSREAFLRPQKL
jgi:2-haloacid dehalogenase